MTWAERAEQAVRDWHNARGTSSSPDAVPAIPFIERIHAGQLAQIARSLGVWHCGHAR